MRRLTIFLFFFIYCQLGIGQESNYPKVDVLMQDFLNKSKLPGISLSINQRGTLIYSKGFGYADMEGQIKMRPQTQVRTASVAKVLTATALGKLVSEGKLDLDTPIGHYISYLKTPFSDLTSRQLAGHTAGIVHRPVSNSAKKKDYNTIREAVKLVEQTELLFEPDTEYKYSSLAYNLLAGVIEEVSGKSYIRYMKENIFMPLQMHQTFPEKKSERSAKDAKMYYFKKGKLSPDPKYFNGSYKLAGAGFRSTSEDLARLMNAYSDGFLREKVVQDMFRSHRLKNGQKTQVGIGWRISKDFQNRPTIEHAGSWQGARTVIVYYPEQQLSITMMINAQCNIFIEETAQVIAQLFLEKSRSAKKV
ncbi:MAG: serine hydrolase domain-containing protein, partial [Bacteroidota bacterium]